MSHVRYAIYVAPDQSSPLGQHCAAVLGRDAWTGNSLSQPHLPGVDPDRLRELTSEPRRYGVHATLKPPFFLAPGTTAEEFTSAAARVAGFCVPFTLPGVELAEIGSFLALVPVALCPELDALARSCVIGLDPFRRHPSTAELARRRARGLTPAQDELLSRYGYPYVLEEFRFHLTLTGRISDSVERARVRAGLCGFLAPVLGHPVPVQDFCIFRQPAPEEPFQGVRRFTFPVM